MAVCAAWPHLTKHGRQSAADYFRARTGVPFDREPSRSAPAVSWEELRQRVKRRRKPEDA